MKKNIVLMLLATASPALAQQDTSYRDGDRMAGTITTSPQGQAIAPKIVLISPNGSAIGTAANPVVVSGGGGGSSVPTGTAGSPNASVVTVQGITNGTPQNVQTLDGYIAPTAMSSAAGTAYTVNLGKGQGTVAFPITGLTASGATLTAQYSDDNGANYYPLRNIGTATVPGATTFTTDGPISFTAGGHTQLRLIVTTAGTGNITIGSNASVPARGVNLEGAGTAATNPFFTRDYGVTAAGVATPFLVSTPGVLAAPTAGVANSTGTVTAVTANTSTTVCPATTNPVVYEVQIYGAAPVLLGLDGQALTSVTPAAGSGAYMLLPTQYTLYSGPVARTNAITAYTGTAMTIVCNIVTRQ